MANDGQIVFEVTADGRRAINDIKDITRTIQQETGKWDDAAKESTDKMGNSFSSMLKQIGAGFSIAKIGKALLDLGKDAVECASDLQEVQNVVDVTFGSSANKIEAWAKKAGTQFGLTETQAKKFTSTIGAMMKSSGMAGNEIVEMSTDLAGLAADMASFYNLDFEEAFSKIRSGISGQTMPLKELGIDMSVATLNAFALQQGLSKTFNEMSQGEQTMLRYQYLMQATADAQGDFARTSDGYANGMRSLETELTSLKANIGDKILPMIQWAVGEINDLFGSDETGGWSRRRTVLDDVADIDVKAQATVEQINATKKTVDELTQSLADIGAKKEELDTVTTNVGTAVQGVSDLASQLSGIKIEDGAKEAFEQTLSVLYSNVTELSKIKGTDAEGVKKWLDGVAEDAKKLSPKDAQAWTSLMSSLVMEIPGIDETDEGKTLIGQLIQYYLSLGSESEEAARGLADLGLGTEEIQDAQRDWLATCKELVRTMPGLSDIIDTNTGEVKGGISAIQKYADEWERTAKYQAQIKAISEKKALYEGLPEQSEVASETRTKRATARAYLMGYGHMTAEQADAALAGAELMAQTAYNGGGIEGQAIDSYGYVNYESLRQNASHAYGFFNGGQFFGTSGFNTGNSGDNLSGQLDTTEENIKKVDGALADYMESLYQYEEFVDIQPQMEAAYQQALDETADAFGMTTDAVEKEAAAAGKAAKAMNTLERAADGDEEAITAVKTAVDTANEALKALSDHVKSVRDSVESSIDSTLKGFEFIGDASQRQAKRLEPLEKELKNLQDEGKELGDINERISNANDTYGFGNMKKNLQSQIAFLNEYKQDMEKARERGFSAEFLAQFADGSVDSAEWLHELAKASDSQVQELNGLWSQTEESKKQLTETLTGQKLSVDDVYQSLAEKAKEAVAALDLEGEAAENSGKTIEGMARGISDHVPEVQEAVDSIIEQLNRLDGYGINIGLGGFGNITFTTSTGKTEGSGRMGIPFIPHDDYIARLHEGERVLTAQENQIWNTLLNGGVSGFDLDSLGGVMRDNIKPGGNVYLDGKVVGSVVSDRQGRSYKSMQRSGWQA